MASELDSLLEDYLRRFSTDNNLDLKAEAARDRFRQEYNLHLNW